MASSGTRRRTRTVTSNRSPPGTAPVQRAPARHGPRWLPGRCLRSGADMAGSFGMGRPTMPWTRVPCNTFMMG